jgi:hypothetical protein
VSEERDEHECGTEYRHPVLVQPRPLRRLHDDPVRDENTVRTHDTEHLNGPAGVDSCVERLDTERVRVGVDPNPSRLVVDGDDSPEQERLLADVVDGRSN